MAKQSKNDQAIRQLLLKSGAVHPTLTSHSRTTDVQASRDAAIKARQHEMQRR